MAVDPYDVVAAGRARGLSDGAIARQLGLKDGQQAYGVMRQDWGDKPAIMIQRPKPAPKAAPVDAPKRIRGLNSKYSTPNRPLAEMIKAAGDIIRLAAPNAQERRCVLQSTIYLISTMARVTLTEISSMYGYADRGTPRHSIKSVRNRMCDRRRARPEDDRQKQIKALLK